MGGDDNQLLRCPPFSLKSLILCHTNSMENKATMTNSTFQTTIEDTTYNGWENYETWNVALWIGNDEGLYNLARRSYSYQDFVRRNFEEGATTLDGVKWDDVNLNLVELDEMMEEL